MALAALSTSLSWLGAGDRLGGSGEGERVPEPGWRGSSQERWAGSREEVAGRLDRLSVGSGGQWEHPDLRLEVGIGHQGGHPRWLGTREPREEDGPEAGHLEFEVPVGRLGGEVGVSTLGLPGVLGSPAVASPLSA